MVWKVSEGAWVIAHRFFQEKVWQVEGKGVGKVRQLKKRLWEPWGIGWGRCTGLAKQGACRLGVGKLGEQGWHEGRREAKARVTLGGRTAERKQGRRNQEGLPGSQRGTRGQISNPEGEGELLHSPFFTAHTMSGQGLPAAGKTLTHCLLRVLGYQICFAKVKLSEQGKRHLLGSLPKSKSFSFVWELHPSCPHLPVRGPVWLVACGPTSPATANENSEKLVWAGPGPFSKNLNWNGEILASDWDNLLKWEDLNTCKLSKATFRPADSWRGWSAWREKSSSDTEREALTTAGERRPWLLMALISWFQSLWGLEYQILRTSF